MKVGRRIVAGVAAAAALAPVAPAQAAKGDPTITVMTRNIYLGGDIFRPVNAVGDKTGLEALVAFGNANWLTREVVDRTSFPTRAKLLANEIRQRKPDLIGLQEVATWRRGPVDYSKLGTPTATKVDYDFLDILLEELDGTYTATVVKEESDVEGPAFPGNDPNAPEAFAARLTMHDVLLKRKASKVRVLKSGAGSYKTNYEVALSGVEFVFQRGYTWADVKLGGKRLRFINTHLESATSRIALAQAKEMLAGPVKAAGKRPVIVVCDCNSDPLDASRKEGDIPHKSAYDRLMRTFHDQWLRFAPARKGFTSGFSEGVDDATTKGIDHRIDLVLARRANGKPMQSVKGWIVGTDPENRSAEGLWPSDHAGVVMKLRP